MNTVNRQKVISLMDLAVRAGELIASEELTIAETRKQKAKLVFMATDVNENIRKKIKDKDSYYEVPCFELSSEAEIAQMIGKPRKVFGIVDAGLAKKTRGLIEGQEGDHMDNKRIYELAKELKESNKDVVEKAQQFGIDIKNHMGTITSSDEKKSQQAFKNPGTKQQATQ